jgi:eukaryotic-like serine/threonine-protein kinase
VSPGEGDRYPASWSPDRRYVAGVQQNPQRGTQFLILAVEGTQRPMDFLPAAVGISRFTFPRISPNGKWIAYCSYESGENELYISSFPSGSGKWQISTNGGRFPVWRRDGKELFYATSDNTIVAVEFSDDNGSPVIGEARSLFRARTPFSPHWIYDVSPDGKRFLINSLQQPASPEPLTLLVNWEAELKKK